MMRHSIRSGMAALVMVALLMAAGPALAQESRRAMDAQVFRPAMDTQGIFVVERADLGKPWSWGFRLAVNGQPSPVHLMMVGLDAADSSAPLSFNVTVNFGFHITFTKWLQLAVDVPFSANGLGDAYDHENPGSFLFHDPTSNANRNPQKVVSGDPRVGLKFGFPLGKKAGGFGLALATFVTVPFGDEATFSGDRGFTFEPKIIASFTRKRFTTSLNIGYLYRLKQQVFDPLGTGPDALALELDDEITWGLGARYGLTKFLDIGLEVYGRVPVLADSRRSDLPIEILLGLGFKWGQISWAIGGGIGVSSFLTQHDIKPFGRAGTFRIFTTIGFVPDKTKDVKVTKDTDRDGITDDKDKCPARPEDKDGFEDEDGCPDPDNDQDGIEDGKDQCPNKPEDIDQFKDEDGCPDPDNDGDGIPDDRDKCPNKPEDKDGFEDDDGCPDLDNDGDGIPDSRDKCKNEPEDKNGIEDEDGCPEGGGGSGFTGGKIDLKGKKVEFKAGAATLLAASKTLLDRVGNLIRNNPAVKLIRIEGHTDDRGNANANLALSRLRARAVLRYLVSRGVARRRLAAVGYGHSRPKVPNTSNKNRAINRRVEFIIVQQERR